MFDKANAKTSRQRVPVRIVCADGEAVDCIVFLAPGARVIDLLNDDRAFLPIETRDGFRAIAKADIRRLTPAAEKAASSGPTQSAKPAPKQEGQKTDYDAYKRPADAWSNDPYEVLGVIRTAPWEAVRGAYLARLKTAHPDRLRAAGVEESLIEAGKELSQRLNAAYAKIAAERKGKAA